MRRTTAGAVAVLILATLASTVGPATAQVAPPPQDIPRSAWVQPGTGNLDGLGTFLYVAPPAPGATQASPFGYEYTLLFTLEGGSIGLMAVGYKDGRGWRASSCPATPRPSRPTTGPTATSTTCSPTA